MPFDIIACVRVHMKRLNLFAVAVIISSHPNLILLPYTLPIFPGSQVSDALRLLRCPCIHRAPMMIVCRAGVDGTRCLIKQVNPRTSVLSRARTPSVGLIVSG